METQQSEVELNKAVIRRFVEEVQNQKNFDVFDELNDPERLGRRVDDASERTASGRSSPPRPRASTPPSRAARRPPG